MFCKTLLVYVLVYLLSDFTYGEKEKKFFPKDYTYIESEESFYKIHTTGQTFADAKQTCALEGATLYYAENVKEVNAVASFWNRTQPSIPWVWVGLTDKITEGHFETVDRRPISEVYSNWQNLQPDNSGNNEDCVHMDLKGTMNDYICDTKANFICKKSLQSLQGNYNCDKPNLDGQRDKKFVPKDYTYIESEESFYKIHTTGRTFADAKQTCALEGASLYYAENIEEVNVVASFWNRTQPSIPWVWVGLTDKMTEGHFETVDGRPISEVYSNWQNSQPDNSGNNEDCVHMDLKGTMNDYICDTGANFICKKSLQSLQRNHNCVKPNLDGQLDKKFVPKDYTYIESEESFYKIHTTGRTFADAKQTCALEGATLYYAENIEEVNAVASFWNRTQPSIPWVWVGLTDKMTEGYFETVDRRPISEVYSNWQNSQPDNTGNNEDCVHMDLKGTMNDYICDTGANFICKKSLQSLQGNYNCDKPNLDGQRDKKFVAKDYTYIESEESFYKIHTTGRTFADAKQTCALEGATLYYAENIEEVNAVASFWKITQPSIPWVWVGLTDKMTEGYFETVDRRPISEVYSNWQNSQPDNSGNNEDCVHMDLKGTMNDYICDTKANFICKKSLQSLQGSYNCVKPNLDGQGDKKFVPKDYTYIESEESFYKIHTTGRTFSDAKQTCALEGATLYYAENVEEVNAVASFWNRTQPSIPWVWVGLTDKMNEGYFETIDRRPISEVYSNWQNLEPDNSGNNEDCVHMDLKGTMNDYICDTGANFICKKSLQSLQGNYNYYKPNLDGQRDKNIVPKDYTYIESEESFYKIHTTGRTFADAKQTCALEGATLYYAENVEEVNAVASFWNRTQPSIPWVWVGLTDKMNEGYFETIDRRPISEVYSNWQNLEPDNSGNNEDCVHMDLKGTMNDYICDTGANFICKKSLQSLQGNYNYDKPNLDGQRDKKFVPKDYTYIESEESFYKIHTTGRTFSDAKQTCALEGATLYYAENVEEVNAVASFWNRTQPSIPWVWVGLTDKMNEGYFETIDRRPISEVYSNWQNLEPDNSGNNEDCVHMDLKGTMNDYICDTGANFICKKSLQSLQGNYNYYKPNLDGQRDKNIVPKDYTYIESEESFYKIHTTGRTFADAKQTCALEGATLYYAENVEEVNAVASFWNRTQPSIPWVWVGLTDKMNEGYFETIDRRPISEVYSNWQNLEPDNSGNNEDCVHMDLKGTMNDYICDTGANFICKKSLQSLQGNYNYDKPNLDGQRDKKFVPKDYTYIESEESFYKIHTTGRTFSDAKRTCALEGATLYYAENVEEVNAVASFWNRTQPSIPWVWVGLTDKMNEGYFETIDRRPISEVYSNWQNLEPDNSGNNEDCVHMDLKGTMNDYICDTGANFICKKSLQSLQGNYNYYKPNLDGQRDKNIVPKDYTYIESEESFYKIHTTGRTFADAKQTCALEGATLYYAENVEEVNAVASFWNRTQPSIPWVWVGLTDKMNEGYFETIDRRPISEVYSNWQNLEPDNSGNNEDCVHMDLKGTMNDYICDTGANFICKKSLQSLQGNYNYDKPNLDGQRDKKFVPKDYTYIESEESFYKIHTTGRTFSDAKQTCALEGATLYYAENVEEVNAVASFWNRTQPSIPWVWVGLTDKMNEGYFETIDRRPISEVYSNWQNLEPDNSGNNEDCVHMDLKGTMNDYICDTGANFICKKSLQSLQGNYNYYKPNLDGQRDKNIVPKDYTYIESEESFYKIHTTGRTFADAKQTCALEGATLYYAENVEEVNAVASFWNRTQPSIPWVWVGLTDKMNEGYFETIDRRPISEVYSNWQNLEPDNSGNNEDCVHMDLKGTMNDYICDTGANFICKKSLQSLQGNYNYDKPNLDGQRDKKFVPKDYTYIESEESFYKIHTTGRTFSDAKQTCALEGATLYYAENVEEVNAVASFWNRTQPSIPWVWVGLTDKMNEGYFETIDRRPISEVYSNWQNCQPDNSGNNQDCVHMDLKGTMNDYICDTKANFICKKSLRSLQWNYNCDMPNLDEQRDIKFFRKDYSYIESEKTFYKVHTTGRTFADAKQRCALEGATLYYAENVDEVNAVASFWNKTQPSIPWVWVGLSDKMVEGFFETVDRRPISEVYSNWQKFQPDNSGDNEDCVHMDLKGTMNDYICDTKANFICKKSLQTLQWNYYCNMPNLDYIYYKNTGKCYKLHTAPLNWVDAYEMCRIEYTTLAVIENRIEADYLALLTKSTPKPRVSEQHQKGLYHVGFHNRFKEGWQTVKGTPMNVGDDVWFDNYQPDGNQYEECGSMFFNGRLINTNCNMKSLFICEHEVKSQYSPLMTYYPL